MIPVALIKGRRFRLDGSTRSDLQGCRANLAGKNQAALDAGDSGFRASASVIARAAAHFLSAIGATTWANRWLLDNNVFDLWQCLSWLYHASPPMAWRWASVFSPPGQRDRSRMRRDRGRAGTGQTGGGSRERRGAEVVGPTNRKPRPINIANAKRVASAQRYAIQGSLSRCRQTAINDRLNELGPL